MLPPAAEPDWYESEERTRHGLIAELQRIIRRFRVRPFRVLLVAALITSGITWRLLTKPQFYDARVVLVMSEESLSSRGRQSLPVLELREYVLSVLLPSSDLLGLVEKHAMFPLRKQLGDEYAIETLWEQVDIQIWKNAFVEFKEGEENDLGSARIGITVTDKDPELAFELAREIAGIIMRSAELQRQRVADEVRAEVDAMREGLGRRQEDITRQITSKVNAIRRARELGKDSLALALGAEIGVLLRDQKKNNDELALAISSTDAIADQVTAAGLDMRVAIVDEQRPDVGHHQRGFVLVLTIAMIAFGSFLVSAFLLGAFDSRVHDTDDVDRLGLPVLGHVPGFAGDHVGSLESRGVRRARVPSSKRWRSHR